MKNGAKTTDEIMRELWERATPEQKYIILRFMQNLMRRE